MELFIPVQLYQSNWLFIKTTSCLQNNFFFVEHHIKMSIKKSWLWIIYDLKVIIWYVRWIINILLFIKIRSHDSSSSENCNLLLCLSFKFLGFLTVLIQWNWFLSINHAISDICNNADLKKNQNCWIIQNFKLLYIQK